MKAITDNNCMKEVLRCVWSVWGGCQLNAHGALFQLRWASQGQSGGPDKDTISLLLCVSHGV